MLNDYYTKFVKDAYRNKAYRPNAHPLDTLMHYNINII